MSATMEQGTARRLRLADLHKTYRSRGRTPFPAVRGIDMDIEPGEMVALLGPSGCGKTTTLRMIAGLESVSSGSVWIGDHEVGDLPPGRRDIGVGFESYALYPPLSVRENLTYGLRARRALPETRIRERVAAVARRLEVTDLLDLRPAALSSGQKQRVALARALMRNPPVLLLDEPLSHLDSGQRQRVRRELKVLQREFGYTTIVVTHDQQEALSLADRMAVMDGGTIQQFGTPDEVFDAPANRFVADFVGEPAINLVPGRAAGGAVDVDSAGRLPTGPAAEGPVEVGLRPQDCHLLAEDASDAGPVATVEFMEDLMEFGLATVALDGGGSRVVVQTEGGVRWAPGDRCRVYAPPERVHLFGHETGERLR